MEESSAVNIIMANPMPVMFVDTCNFGNIFRDALEGRDDCVFQTLEWLNDAGVRNRYHLVLPEQIIEEYKRPGKFVEPEIYELRERLNRWESMLKTYNKVNPSDAKNFVQYFDVQMADALYKRFFNLIGNIFNKALIISSSKTAQCWCRQRLHDCKRPARRGKNSFGDCEICGASLSLMRQLREVNFPEDAYFVSANTTDYMQNKDLHDDLKFEFQQVRMEYCCTIKNAYGQIRRKYEISRRGLSK